MDEVSRNSETPDSTLDSLIGAIARRDLKQALAVISADSPAVIGSETGEGAREREDIEAFFVGVFARPGSFRFEFPERTWTVHGEVAWLVAEGTVVEPTGLKPNPYRLTAVFVRDGADWKLALWSGAEPRDHAP